MSLGDDGPRGPWDIAGIHGLQRAREWDAVVALDAPELEGDRTRFFALPDGTVVVEEGATNVTILAEGVDAELRRPYRAEAVRRAGGLWAVAARAIETVELPGISGSEIELVTHGGDEMLSIDGERSHGTITALARPGYVVYARRIVGDVWEVDANPL